MPLPGLRKLLLLLWALVLAACASTTLQDQWRNPAYVGGPFRKFLVMGVSGEPTMRRIFEDAMVARLAAAGVQAAPSYTFIADGAMATEAQIDLAVRQAAAAALMMTRVRGVTRETQVSTVMVPGPAMGFGWWGAYSAWYPMQQVTQFDIAIVETTVYSTRNREVVWSGVTQTFNPQSVRAEAPGLADVIVKALVGNGLIAADAAAAGRTGGY